MRLKSSIPVMAMVLALGQALVLAQTPIKLPKNKFTPQQDVDLGLKAAAEVRKQYPVIQDGFLAEYLQTLGSRLVAAAPADLNRKEFRYSFTPVNVKEINAFALPGGPMFVNRGMFEAAATEGEVAGVMAHELSHVLLRHGTANATKAENPWLQLGQIAGAIGGAVVGGGLGEVISTGTGLGLGAFMLKYSREFEKQADLLGSQIMARAGYDPRDLGRMFETIERSSGGGAPEWMSSHPNPGNRTKYIADEAAALKIGPRPDTRGFQTAKTRFASLPAAESMADIEKRASTRSGESAPSVGTPGRPVPAPSAEFIELTGGNVFQADVPDNWTKMSSKSAIRVVPQNGYGDLNGQSVFTHGVEFGVSRAASRDLTEATRSLLQGFAQGNPDLRVAGQQQSIRLSARTALYVPLENPSALGGRERISLTTVFLSDGTLFYYMTVVQERDAAVFEPVFRKIARSIRLTETR
jgi:Zn-dependent protease with chaperone function